MTKKKKIKIKKKRIETVFDRAVGRPGRAMRLLVSEGEIPVVDSLCSGDVDDIVKHNPG